MLTEATKTLWNLRLRQARPCLPGAQQHPWPQEPEPGPRGAGPCSALTSLGRLRREKTRRGQRRCRWPEHQPRMLSHSTVRAGAGPSSRCSSTSCFWARTAVLSSIRSS